MEREYAIHLKNGSYYAVQGHQEGYSILTLVGVRKAGSAYDALCEHLERSDRRVIIDEVVATASGVERVEYHYEDK